jgi:hypothetical protein
VGELLLCEPYFHFKCFLMLGAELVAHAVLNGAEPALLQPFLQGRLVIGAIQASNLATEGAVEKRVAEEEARGGEPAVEINRTDDSFVCIGKQTFFAAAARFLFARTEPQIIAQSKLFCRRMQRDSVHEPRQSLGKLPGIPVGERMTEHFAGDKTENAVAEKFEPLII